MKKIFTFHPGGIHPPQLKGTADMAITPAPKSGELTIMLGQSIGAPSKPVVKTGQKVAKGEPIAEPGGYVSAWLHSPCEGKVKKIADIRGQQGLPAQAIVIERDEQGAEEFRFPPIDIESATSQQIVERVRLAGIVGLGGATFPTDVKLTPPPGMKAECVILNGAECEPALTCDDRLMREHAPEIVQGARALMRAVGVRLCYIGIETNKPQAIEAMRQASKPYADIRVCPLRTKYPQGGEKQLIKAILGREVPSGALPVSVGAVVDNVATAYAVYQALVLGKPLTERVLTVCGPGAENPGNYLVEIGTPLSSLITLTPEADKLLGGGPMMGRAIKEIDAPSTKGLSGLMGMLPPGEGDLTQPPKATACIRCAACYEACPMGLEPMLLARFGTAKEWEESKVHGVLDCIECGSCNYVCPATRPLLDWIRYSKRNLK